MREITKTYYKPRKKGETSHHDIWEQREAEPVYQCKCGNKYLKTRLKQKTCLQCLLHSNCYKTSDMVY